LGLSLLGTKSTSGLSKGGGNRKGQETRYKSPAPTRDKPRREEGTSGNALEKREGRENAVHNKSSEYGFCNVKRLGLTRKKKSKQSHGASLNLSQQSPPQFKTREGKIRTLWERERRGFRLDSISVKRKGKSGGRSKKCGAEHPPPS